MSPGDVVTFRDADRNPRLRRWFAVVVSPAEAAFCGARVEVATLLPFGDGVGNVARLIEVEELREAGAADLVEPARRWA